MGFILQSDSLTDATEFRSCLALTFVDGYDEEKSVRGFNSNLFWLKTSLHLENSCGGVKPFYWFRIQRKSAHQIQILPNISLKLKINSKVHLSPSKYNILIIYIFALCITSLFLSDILCFSLFFCHTKPVKMMKGHIKHAQGLGFSLLQMLSFSPISS